jgi:hypothetical protein
MADTGRLLAARCPSRRNGAGVYDLRTRVRSAYTLRMSNVPPVAAAELRRHLRDHLDGVLQGRTFEIARNGRVVAVLAPPEEAVEEVNHGL